MRCQLNNDKENRKYYNRLHYFGFEENEEFEDFLDEKEFETLDDEDDDNDDFLLTEDF